MPSTRQVVSTLIAFKCIIGFSIKAIDGITLVTRPRTFLISCTVDADVVFVLVKIITFTTPFEGLLGEFPYLLLHDNVSDDDLHGV